MIFLIETSNILKSLEETFKTYIPEAKHYMGDLPEAFEAPCFLYKLVFSGETQESYFTKVTTVDIQILYFGKQGKNNQGSFEEKQQVIQKLKVFLSQFNLRVNGRNLKFTYSFVEVDGQLTINIQTSFKDGVTNLKYEEEQRRNKIQDIFINDKGVI